MKFIRMTGLIAVVATFSCSNFVVTACTNSGINPMANKIVAQAVLKSSDGLSILDTDPESVVIDEHVIEEASKKLRALGCDVLTPGTHSLSISCDKQVFEQIFKTSVEQIEASSDAVTKFFFQCRRPVTIPDSLVPYVADVLLPVPPALDL